MVTVGPARRQSSGDLPAAVLGATPIRPSSTMTGMAGAWGSAPIGRRTVVRGAAWSAPVVVLGVAAPAVAASTGCTPRIDIVTLTAAFGGFDLWVNDRKYLAPNGGTDFASNTYRIPTLTFRVTCDGVPLAGVEVKVIPDGATDHEGNLLLRFVSPTSGDVIEAPGPAPIFPGVTNSSGLVSFGVPVAELDSLDPLFVNGTFTVSITSPAASTVFTYSVRT